MVNTCHNGVFPIRERRTKKIGIKWPALQKRHAFAHPRIHFFRRSFPKRISQTTNASSDEVSIKSTHPYPHKPAQENLHHFPDLIHSFVFSANIHSTFEERTAPTLGIIPSNSVLIGTSINIIITTTTAIRVL